MVSGSFWIFYLFDVAEGIDMGVLGRILGVTEPPRGTSFRHRMPMYVRFEQPPLAIPLAPVELETGERLEARASYFDHGVISLEMQLPFQTSWSELVRQSSRWVEAPDLEKKAAEVMVQCLERASAALVKPVEKPLAEDYCIVHVQNTPGEDTPVSAEALIASRGADIAQIVRGEQSWLSTEERAEILQSRMSYYPNDLAVIGWSAAFLYDTAEGAAPGIRLLEYANAQLVEFRYYDELLTRVLADVYKSVERRTGPLARWRLARDAERLYTIVLDVRELSERVDNAIKFLSDMFSARFYRLAAAKVGVSDYRRLVDEKLRTASDLYHFMVDQHHHGRAFVLELMVVIILIIDLIYLFRGKM